MSPAQFKLAAGWLAIFSALCVINAIVLGFVTAFGGPASYLDISMMVPFAHCGIWWILTMLYTVFCHVTRPCPYPDDIYLKNKYPVIWAALHPFGNRSFNMGAEIRFQRGTYDDGKDKQLNQIKERRKRGGRIFMWGFFLVPTVWVLDIVAVAVASLVKR